MGANQYTINDAEGNPITITVRPDRRLKKSARWTRERDGTVILRVPYRLPRQNLEKILSDIEKQIARQRKPMPGRTDEDLQSRAVYVNRKFFGGDLDWSSIRWVSNMSNRLGSCTNGGPTDGQIRISERVRDWPQWVVDYVIAHELAHRKHPNHSQEFWAYLRTAFPQTEKALGFIQGVGFAHNEVLNEDD